METDDYGDSTNIKSEISETNRKLDTLLEQKKVKGWKLPWKARLSKNKAAKGFVTVIFLNQNKTIEFVKKKVEEGVYTHNGQPYVATAGYHLSYKGKPMIFQPGWSITPFDPKRDIDKAYTDKRVAVGYKLILNMLMREAISDKKKMTGGMIILGLVLAGVAIYLFTGGKLF